MKRWAEDMEEKPLESTQDSTRDWSLVKYWSCEPGLVKARGDQIHTVIYRPLSCDDTGLASSPF